MSDAPLGRTKATLGWPFSLVLNRLLDANPEARARLAPFAGETVEVRNPPFPPLVFTILPGGRIEADAVDAPQAVVTLRPLARTFEVQGEPRLAAELRTLLQGLPGDAEEALSRVVGDIAAHRIARAGRGLLDWQADALRRLGTAAADYAVEEKRVLVARDELERFTQEVASLREALGRLEERVARLG